MARPNWTRVLVPGQQAADRVAQIPLLGGQFHAGSPAVFALAASGPGSAALTAAITRARWTAWLPPCPGQRPHLRQPQVLVVLLGVADRTMHLEHHPGGRAGSVGAGDLRGQHVPGRMAPAAIERRGRCALPLRVITSSASGPVNRVLTGTGVAPADSAEHGGHPAMRVRDQIATRSPGITPSAMSARVTVVA